MVYNEKLRKMTTLVQSHKSRTDISCPNGLVVDLPSISYCFTILPTELYVLSQQHFMRLEDPTSLMMSIRASGRIEAD